MVNAGLKLEGRNGNNKLEGETRRITACKVRSEFLYVCVFPLLSCLPLPGGGTLRDSWQNLMMDTRKICNPIIQSPFSFVIDLYVAHSSFKWRDPWFESCFSCVALPSLLVVLNIMQTSRYLLPALQLQWLVLKIKGRGIGKGEEGTVHGRLRKDALEGEFHIQQNFEWYVSASMQL